MYNLNTISSHLTKRLGNFLDMNYCRTSLTNEFLAKLYSRYKFNNTTITVRVISISLIKLASMQ